ncbi:F-box DNA helicase 1-like isoform X2 [Procambarus clarkii]|uniref:F-box DNA helicase 1-like isoform X2 n=1 Tax=Procambarus clarkii TaxID=6728 RepID=UPI0037445A6F
MVYYTLHLYENRWRNAGVNYHEELPHVSVGQQLPQVFVGKQLRQVFQSQQLRQVYVDQQLRQNFFVYQLEQLFLGQRQRRVSVGQQPRRVSVGQQPRRVSVGQQPRRESVGQQPRRVSVGQQPRRVSVGQQPRRVSVGQQPRQVSVGQQPRQVSVGQQTTQKFIHSETFHLTEEQLRIINHKIKANHIVKIDAFAGAGKTTTLRRLCQERPHTRFLLLLPSVTLAEQCSQTFPINVTVTTAESLALSHIGTHYKTLDLVRRTVNCFVSSSNECITLQHVRNDTLNRREIETVTDKYQYEILSIAESVWKEMNRCSVRQQISMTQDGLVKAWQLTKPRIQGYDVLLVDGAEDISDAVLDIILNQHCAKVFVGDSYQQLGSSGGTVSALDKVTHTHKFFLHQSFRFGPEVSYVAQCTLEALHGVPHRTVVGAKIKDSFVHAPNPRLFDPSSKLKRAYIAKSNVELYKIATEMCEDTRYLAASMTFAGGLSKYGYDDVMDIFNLYQIQEGLATRESANIQNPLVAKFETVAELKEYAESNDDDELFSKIEMFNYSGSRTPYHVTLLTQRCSNTEASVADITFSTVHMAKGLEWDWVILTGDFIDNNIILITNIDEELRLAYVSVTRARKFFTINKAVLYALLFAHDELDVLVARKSVEESVVCLWCRTLVTPASSPLIIKALSYYICHSGNRFPGGYMCNGCATNEIFEAAIRTHRSIDCEMEVFARASRLRLITGSSTNQPATTTTQRTG